VIVVIGSSRLRGEGAGAVAGSLADRIASVAAANGASVERIARVGDDPTGDALLLALTRSGVGHVAVLRDASHATEHERIDADDLDVAPDPEPAAAGADGSPASPPSAPALDGADVELALRDLTDFRVVVAAHPSPGIVDATVAAAAFANAHLVIVLRPGEPVPASCPPDALVLAAADDLDERAALAGRLGGYAAAVDRGDPVTIAYARLTAEGDGLDPDSAG
jgi:hypothetical protein